MYVANKGNAPPKDERRNVFAAIADAALERKRYVSKFVTDKKEERRRKKWEGKGGKGEV